MRIFLAILILLCSSLNAAEPEKNNKALFKGDMGNAPTFIKSDSLSLNAETRVFTYTGNVEVKQKDMILTSEILEGKYDENNKIQSLEARKNVSITQGPELRARSQKAVYTASDEILVLTESPELEQKGSLLTADRIIIYTKENRSEAQGTVQVKLLENK